MPDKFVKPTLDQVTKYMYEIGIRNAKDQAETFMDTFDMCGWVVGKTRKPMRDWRAAVRNWKRNIKEWAKEQKPAPHSERSGSGNIGQFLFPEQPKPKNTGLFKEPEVKQWLQSRGIPLKDIEKYFRYQGPDSVGNHIWRLILTSR